LQKIFDRVNDGLVVLACGIAVFWIGSITYAVVTRYALGFVTRGLFQIWEYGLLWVPLLGAAWLLQREGHVKLDILVIRLPARPQAVLNFITSLLGGGLCLLLTYYSAHVTWEAYVLGLTFVGEINVPRYVVNMILPAGFALLSIQFVRRAHGYFQAMRKAQ